MTKISKNIKTIRTKKGITQENLATKMNVTRQAISSWETGRTQPDFEMLLSLSKTLEVSIEELLYGEKRNTTIDNREKPRLTTGTIVISVLGTLLICTGLILLLINYYSNFPWTLRQVIKLLPLLIGQGFALFVYFKKSDSIAFKETSSLVWILGYGTTIISMLSNSFSGETTLFNIVVILLGAGIPLLTDSITPIAFIYGYMIVAYTVSASFYKYIILAMAVTLVVLHDRFFTKKSEIYSSRSTVTDWLNIIFVIAWFITISIEFETAITAISVLSVSSVIYITRKDDKNTSPSYVAGMLATAASMTIATIFNGTGYFDSYFIKTKGEIFTAYAWLLICLILPPVLYYIKRNIIKKNIFKIAQAIISYLLISSKIIYMFLESFNSAAFTNLIFDNGKPRIHSDTIIPLLSVFLLLAFGLSLILEGSKNNRLLNINLGTALVFASIYYVMMFLGNMTFNAIILIIMGIAFITVNIWVSGKFKKEAALEESQVNKNEE